MEIALWMDNKKVVDKELKLPSLKELGFKTYTKTNSLIPLPISGWIYRKRYVPYYFDLRPFEVNICIPVWKLYAVGWGVAVLIGLAIIPIEHYTNGEGEWKKDLAFLILGYIPFLILTLVLFGVL